MLSYIDSNPCEQLFFGISIGCRTGMDFTKYGPKRKGLNHIAYVTKGKGYFNGNPVTAGQGFLLYSGPVLEYHPDENDPMEYLWFSSADSSFRAVMDSYNVDPNTLIFEYDFTHKVQALMKTVIKNHKKSFPASQIMEMFLQIYNSHNYKPDYVYKDTARLYADACTEFIETNIHTPVTVDMLTELLGISQPYLHRIFIRYMSMSPKQYILRRKLDIARKLLLTTDMSITEVANSVGYSDALAFSRIFSKKEKQSPKEYRASKKEK